MNEKKLVNNRNIPTYAIFTPDCSNSRLEDAVTTGVLTLPDRAYKFNILATDFTMAVLNFAS